MAALIRHPAQMVDAGGMRTLAEELAQTDSCRLDGLWPDALRRHLAAEARARAPLARLSRRVGHTVPGWPADSRQYWLDSGPLLTAMLHTPQLLALAGQLAGSGMTPFQAAYLYYPPGAYCGLHTDRAEFGVQMMVSLHGDVAPLLLHPELASATTGDLAELAGPALGDRGVRLAYTRTGVTIFRGTRIPHERPPQAGPATGIVLALTYRSATD
ncbi:hypothetical protein [Streptomyces niveiscabiei]|uniref:Fe2OG dioxygenase domain-containing protein n=1 Tax=Streptomyces niveiscabiei TaxID=164115 RepID=A0ABW9HH31_9ACTN